jgi:alkylhydroperoxidase family enzyme
MPWIRTITVGQATGRLKRTYDAAIARAGKVFGIVRAMSVDPETLDVSMALYQRLMLARGALPRRQREMLAVVVSRANSCHY